MQTEKDRILELRKALEYHNYKYYIENAPEISDREFDGLMHDLEKLEEKYPEMYDHNSPTQRVGRDINQEFTQVAHKYPMLSLGNTYSEEELRDFDQRVRKVVGVYNVDGLKYEGIDANILDKIHRKKIDISDAIYVVNIDGYIGNSTKKEIEYALNNGKEVIYHEPIN